MFRKALMSTTAFAVVVAAGHPAHAASDIVADDVFARALSREMQQRGAVSGGGTSGFNWSLQDMSAQDDPRSIDGQDLGLSLGYDNTDVSIRGKWDNRYQTRGGVSFGATLDDQKQKAIGGGFLANEDASEFYGQYQFILPGLDPLSSFTLGEYVTREDQSFTAGSRQVWGYTTYLNWFKRNDGRQSIDADLPPGLRTGLQSLLNNTSAISAAAAYTHSPKISQGTEGSPRTNALDLSVRGVSPAVFGEFFPVSLGAGVNAAHYDYVDDTAETNVTGNGGAGIAFMGGDYFKHRFHWLLGLGADADTRGVFGGTVAAEISSLSVSYRQTSDQQSTVLISWRISDLWTEKNQLAGDGGRQMPLSPLDYGEGHLGRSATAENSLMRLGFLPPTGSETIRSSASGSPSNQTNPMQLSPVGAAQQPLQVQQAIHRIQKLQEQVREQKNSEVRSAEAGPTKATIYGLVRSGAVSFSSNQTWATFARIENAGLSNFTSLCSDGATPAVSLTANKILVDMFGMSMCTSIQVFQDGVSLGSVAACFIAGTGVLMADGSEKPIEDVRLGEWLKGADGESNQVLELHRPLLGDQHLYAINGGRHFVTDGHPFMTIDGWKAMDVAMAERVNPGLVVGRLQVGDVLLTDSGETQIETIDLRSAPPETQLYNFAVSGNRTFFVREGETAYLVHNK